MFAHYVHSSLITLTHFIVHRLPTFWRTCWRPSAAGLNEFIFLAASPCVVRVFLQHKLRQIIYFICCKKILLHRSAPCSSRPRLAHKSTGLVPFLTLPASHRCPHAQDGAPHIVCNPLRYRFTHCIQSPNARLKAVLLRHTQELNPTHKPRGLPPLQPRMLIFIKG